MAQFNMVITDIGAALHAAIIAGGDVLNFTKMQSGSGALPGGTDADDRTAMVTLKQTVAIASLTLTGSTATVRADFSNAGLGAGYTWTELGLWAQDTPGGGADILYAYGNSAGSSDYVPAGGGADTVTVIQEVGLTVGSVAVTATIDESAVYATMADLAAARPFYRVKGFRNSGINPTTVIDATYFDGVTHGGLPTVRSWTWPCGPDGSFWLDFTYGSMMMWLRVGIKNPTAVDVVVPIWIPEVDNFVGWRWNGGAQTNHASATHVYDIDDSFTVLAHTQGVLDVYYYNETATDSPGLLGFVTSPFNLGLTFYDPGP